MIHQIRKIDPSFRYRSYFSATTPYNRYTQQNIRELQNHLRNAQNAGFCGPGAAFSNYGRPSNWRKGVRQEAWNQNAGANGVVYDPLTGLPMSPNNPWHMGHRPGYEFWRHQYSAGGRGVPRSEFRNEHQNPSHYRPELPRSNMSHHGEMHGPGPWRGE